MILAVSSATIEIVWSVPSIMESAKCAKTGIEWQQRHVSSVLTIIVEDVTKSIWNARNARQGMSFKERAVPKRSAKAMMIYDAVSI